MPLGLIIPLNADSVPDKWQAFTAPNGKMIVGAGSSYAIGATGGGSFSENRNTTSNGAHLGSIHGITSQFDGVDGTYVEVSGTTTGGAHAHDVGVSYDVPRRKIQMIKNIQKTDRLPINAVIPSIGEVKTASNILAGEYLQADSSVGQVSETKESVVGMAGAHRHPTGVYVRIKESEGNNVVNFPQKGEHNNGTLALTASANLKRILLSLWSSATKRLPISPNMIAMWEGTTAPDGWKLCDGTLSTPDLRDYFIMPCAAGSESVTQAGNNTVIYSITISHNAPHGHSGIVKGVYEGAPQSNPNVNSADWDHSHSIPEQVQSWIPAYYALTFIMAA